MRTVCLIETQYEYNELCNSDNIYDEILIDSNERITINKAPHAESRIVIKSRTRASVYKDISVTCENNANVVLYDESRAIAKDKSTVHAYNKSIVRAIDCSDIYAFDNVTPYAHDYANASCYDNSDARLFQR